MLATYGVTVSSPPLEEPAREAKASAKSTKITMSVAAVTGWVVIGKVPELAPAGMVRVAGTEAALGVSLLGTSLRPPAGAGWLKCTVPVTIVPPFTSRALRVTIRLILSAGWGGLGGLVP